MTFNCGNGENGPVLKSQYATGYKPVLIAAFVKPSMVPFYRLPLPSPIYYYSPEVRANIANTLRAKRTAFTRSAVTSPKVNRFG